MGLSMAPWSDPQPAKNMPKEKKLYKNCMNDDIFCSCLGKLLEINREIEITSMNTDRASKYMLAKFMFV